MMSGLKVVLRKQQCQIFCLEHSVILVPLDFPWKRLLFLRLDGGEGGLMEAQEAEGSGLSHKSMVNSVEMHCGPRAVA